MKKLLTLLLLLITSLTLAQSVTNYTFTASSGTYTPLSGATTATLSSGTTDDGAYNGLPIGFTFVYMGIPYTTVSYSTNGWMTFGQNITVSAFTNNLTSGGTRPIVAPLWDDLDMASGNVQYKTEGTAPNRVFTLQVSNVEWNYQASGGVISFQIKLYESNGAVEFVYKQESVAVNDGSASIGITATATGSGNFLSLDGTGGSPSVSSTIETTTLNTKPANGQTYTFTPPAAPADPTGLSFSGVTMTAMTLNWTDNATTETGYLVYRSLDGVTYTLIATLAANSTSYNATGLGAATTYHWRVVAINEGRLSSPLDGSQATSSGTLSGTLTIGPSGNYSTLTAAITDIQTNGLAGALILEFLSGYTSGSETFPITFTNLFTSHTSTLTVRPQSGVTGISISGSNTTAIIRIVNEDYIFIDGRPGGTGTDRELTITNTGAGPTILFIDDASNNTVRYCNVVGSANTSNTSGVIVFGATSNTTGNDNNTIEYCDINAFGSAVGIYSAGTTGKDNDGNVISNNNIRDFYISSTSTISTYGIRLSTASSAFTISGNSFYQTSSRTYSSTSAIHYIIGISNTSGNGFVISDNFLGGNAPNAVGTYVMTGGQQRLFAMDLSVGTTTPTSIQGNTITAIVCSTAFTTTGSSGFIGMNLAAGSFNVGTTTGNTIGSGTSTGAINLHITGSTGPLFVGINCATSSGTTNISNNTIGGLLATTTTATAYLSLYPISVSGSGHTVNISNNLIGSTSVANSIYNNTGSTSTATYQTRGMNITSTGVISITNNTVANLTASGTGSSTTLAGIYISATSPSSGWIITGNTVRNLTNSSSRTTFGSILQALSGIAISGSQSHFVSGNTIHTLINNSTSGQVSVVGLYFSGSASLQSTIQKNFIHSIKTSSSNIWSSITGIMIAGGLHTLRNNMIRLGIDEAGNSITTEYNFTGILKTVATVGSYFHNSVYIGGTGVGTNNIKTFAFRKNGTSGADSLFNNIFFNARSNATTGGNHYAIGVNQTSGLISDYNVFIANGNGGVVATRDTGGTTNYTLALWQTNMSVDNNSFSGNPNFVAPNGDASSVDLHLANPTPCEGVGMAISYVTDDFDGEDRSTLTPTDIGADAGNFTLADIFPPVISYTAFNNTISTSNRTLASVTITDHTGVPTSGSLQPRIWFRRSAPTPTSWGSTQGSLQSGTGTNGVWSFTIDYNVLGVTPAVGETYQYYVVAQDEVSTPNIRTNPSGGVHTDVNTQTSPPATPNSYNIVNAVSGSYFVPGDYPNLTGASGFFKFVNDNVVTGNVTVNITSDLTEDGTHGLNQWVEEGGSGFTMLIQSSAATERLISGAVTNGMIRLNGADRVTIDGRVGGSGKYLRFRNTNTDNPTITLLNDASDNTIRDCYIEGATTSTSNGVVFFSTGATTGNDNNMIRDCVIRDRSDAAGVPANLIFSQGSSSTVRNSNNTILNCQLFNFTRDGISLSSTNDANESWTITGNDISQNATATSTITGIRLNSYGNNLVSQNLIHDLNTSGTVRGIYVDDITNVTIERNRIYNIPSTSGSIGTLYGIYVFGFNGNCRARIYNNQISIVPSHSNAQTVYGIREFADNGDSIYLFYNSVFVGGTGSGTSKSYAYDDNSGTTHNVVYNNAFVNVRTGGTGGHFAARHVSTGSITSTLTDNNFYVGNGPTAGNNFELSSTASSFTSWKAAYTGAKKDNYSYSINSADLTVSNLFTNAPSGDLSVINTNQECWLLNGKGQPIATVNNDYAGNSRSTSVANGPTDIGAYEFTPTVNPPAATSSGPPSPSSTTTYSVAGNTVTSIAWGGSGTVPTSVDVQYYSGTQAPSSVNKPRINAYWNITQTGGSGFTYDITLTYDEAHLGNIEENNLVPAKSDDGGNTWTPFLVQGTGPNQFQRNTTANTITIYGLTSFSMFTLGDNNDPLPVQLSSFTASTKGRDVILNWTTATEVNTAGFEIERKLVSQEKAQAKWENVGFVRGNGNSNRPIEYTFTDMKLNTGKYAYRLKMIDNDGSYEYSDEVQVEIGKPDVTKIEQNYPNAFNPATKIEYQLANPSKVVIEVYNITGQKITELVNDEQVEGYYSLVFDASKYGLASGIYFYRMIAMDRVTGKNVVQTKKMLYLK